MLTIYVSMKSQPAEEPKSRGNVVFVASGVNSPDLFRWFYGSYDVTYLYRNQVTLHNPWYPQEVQYLHDQGFVHTCTDPVTGVQYVNTHWDCLEIRLRPDGRLYMAVDGKAERNHLSEEEYKFYTNRSHSLARKEENARELYLRARRYFPQLLEPLPSIVRVKNIELCLDQVLEI